MSKKEGKRYRLPTEAEWEYACRAGTKTRFFCGDDPAELLKVANVPDATYSRSMGQDFKGYECLAGIDGFSGLAPVGSFAPNPWGLYDMHGNVWEWCADGYGADLYTDEPVSDPVGSLTLPTRAMRGGCFM